MTTVIVAGTQHRAQDFDLVPEVVESLWRMEERHFLCSLYTVIDEFSGHKTRFERGEMTTLFESVGLRNVEEHGIFASTLPVQRLERLCAPKPKTPLTVEARTKVMTRALRVPASPVNAVLGLLARVERSLGLKSARGRTGASILAVGCCE